MIQVFVNFHSFTLQVSVDHPVHLEVIVIFTERIYQLFGHFQPSHVEEKLQHAEDGEIQVDAIIVALIFAFVFDPLLSHL